jgi:hypothetical protein
MSLTVHTNQGAYNLTGRTDHRPTQDQSGVYVISTNAGSHHKVIDAGESHAIKTRVGSHDRAQLWKQHASTVCMHRSTTVTKLAVWH